MDKLIFFDYGKFYNLYYEDAITINKYFDLAWMGNKLHVSFHNN